MESKGFWVSDWDGDEYYVIGSKIVATVWAGDSGAIWTSIVGYVDKDTPIFKDLKEAQSYIENKFKDKE